MRLHVGSSNTTGGQWSAMLRTAAANAIEHRHRKPARWKEIVDGLLDEELEQSEVGFVEKRV
jgi:hypothetical protein